MPGVEVVAITTTAAAATAAAATTAGGGGVLLAGELLLRMVVVSSAYNAVKDVTPSLPRAGRVHDGRAHQDVVHHAVRRVPRVLVNDLFQYAMFSH